VDPYWLYAAAVLFVLAWIWTFMAILLWRKEGHKMIRRRINDYTMK